VSGDAQEANAAFHAKFSFSFPLLSDPDKAMIKAFDCCRPSKDGADPCAMAKRVTVVVDNGLVVKVLDPFDAKDGPAALLADLS